MLNLCLIKLLPCGVIGSYNYGFNGAKQLVVLSDMRDDFPSVGHLFRLGALSPNTAQCFSRSAALDFNVKIPFYNPRIAEAQGD